MVFGPAGYGKTCLLADWFDGPECRTALRIWCRADQQDLDFSVFVTTWLNEVRRVVEGRDMAPGSTTTVLRVQDVSSGIAALHDLVAGAGKPMITIIDDFQVIDLPEFTRPFLQALRNLPPNLHVVLVSSSMPKALFEGAGGFVGVPAIGPEMLALTAAEIATVMGNHPVDANELAEMTSGWPAIIALIAGALDGGAPTELGDLLKCDSVHAYVSHHLLADLHPETRDVLTGLATLSQVPVSLAASAVGESATERLTEAAWRLRPLFTLEPVPPACFKYHPILQHSLEWHRVHLPARLRHTIDTAAVNWFVGQHAVGPALDYALKQRLSTEVVRLAEYFGPHTITLHAGVPLLRATFDAIDADTIRNSARLLTGRATVLMKDGRFALAKAALDEAGVLLQRHGERGPVFGSPHVDLVNARYLMMLYNNDEFDQSFIGDEQSEIRQLSIEDGIVGFVYALRSIWFQRRSSFRRAEYEAGRSLYHYRKAGSGYGEASVLMVKGMAALAQGRLQKAESAYDSALAIIQSDYPDDPGLNATCSVLMAEVLFERNEVDTAAEMLHAAIETLEESDGWLDPYASAYRVGVGVCLARGDEEGAVIQAERAAQLAAQRGLVEIERLAQLFRAEIQLRRQLWREAETEWRRYAALRTAPDRRRGAKDMAREQELADLVELRLMLGREEPGSALERIQPLAEMAEREGRYLQLTRLRVMAALAHWKLEQDRAALSALQGSVELAAGKGYVRLFVDWGTELVPVMRRLIDCHALANARADRAARAVLRAIAKEQQSTGSLQPFSTRELQVLSYLSRGQSNKQIARQLDVTESCA